MQCLTSACEPMTEIFCRQLAEFFFSGTVRVCFLFFCCFFSDPAPPTPAGDLSIPAQAHTINLPFFFSKPSVLDFCLLHF